MGSDDSKPEEPRVADAAPGQRGPPATGFDIQAVYRKMPLSGRVFAGASLGLAIAVFLPWYSVSFHSKLQSLGAFGGTSASGFAFTLGVFCFLFALGGIALPFLLAR